MTERPPYIKTEEVFVTDYFYNLTKKEKRELETFIIKLALQEDDVNRTSQPTGSPIKQH